MATANALLRLRDLVRSPASSVDDGVDLDATLQLVMAPHNRQHHDRQEHALRVLTDQLQQQQSIYDLSANDATLLTNILLAGAERAAGDLNVASQLTRLISVIGDQLALPCAFEHRNIGLTKELLQSFAEMLQLPCDAVCQHMPVMLQQLLNEPTPADMNDWHMLNGLPAAGQVRVVRPRSSSLLTAIDPTSDRALLARLIGDSELPTVLLWKSSQANVHHDLKDSILTLLHSLQPLQLKSVVAVKYLLAAIHCEQVPAMLMRLTDFMWSMLESKEEREWLVNVLATDEQFLADVVDMWSSASLQDESSRGKLLRNNWTLLLMLCLNSPQCNTAALKRTNFTQLVIRLMQRKSIKKSAERIPREDLELDLLLANLLVALCKLPDAFNDLLQLGLMNELVARLNTSLSASWAIGPMFAMKAEYLALCTSILPAASQYFRAANIATVCSRIFTAIIVDKDSLALAHHKSRIALVDALCTFITCTVRGDSEFRNDFYAEATVPALLTCLDSFPGDQTSIAIVMTISTLCENHPKNQQEFGKSQGVHAILAQLIQCRRPNGEQTELLALAGVECIWQAVTANSTNAKELFDMDGVAIVLDLLATTACQRVKCHVLGCLLDLLENPLGRAHALEWHSAADPTQSIPNELLRLWCAEEQRLGMAESVDNDRVLKPRQHPLMYTPRHHPSQTLQQSQAITELSANIRAKIFAMFSKLGFDLFKERLSTAERVTLTFVQKYLDFKLGEVWSEISAELAYQGIRPTTPDAECLAAARDVTLAKAEAVSQKQRELCDRKLQHETGAERELYALLLQSTTQKYTGATGTKRDSKKVRIHAALRDAQQPQHDK